MMKNSIHLVVVVAATFVLGCQSVEQAVKHAKRPPPPDNAPLEQRAVPERDARRSDDDLLALVAEKTRRVQELEQAVDALQKELAESRKKEAAARQSESKLAQDVERLQGLLDDALAREKALQARVLESELKAVRLEQELYRRRLESLSSKTDRGD